MTCDEVMTLLAAQTNETNRAGMARYGIKTDDAFGISIYELRKIARPLRGDHDLALALWHTGNHEARLLAGMIDDPKLVTEEQIELWVADFDSWDVCDQVCSNLFDRTPWAHAKAVEWSARDEEFVKRAGFVLMACLAVHDKEAPDEVLRRFLPIIEAAVDDERNFVKKVVNWALRQIGKRNRALNAAAIAAGERIRDAASAPGGGSRAAAGLRSARWIAADALRELTSDKLQKRLTQ
jgi:3-methyladenine DNA glycosylase AlkD